ncbi:hypothetical protein LLEC1_03821 [Akanthomyces lecanii]|uniref:Uncharacterized protein n=1 Tax=Cordyceps confragosa TaxID=2714763 RepID=A0A179IKT2_CORDF|nr:hypothetical protein LLEC1_03821 [Akanthomyces lecanii]
MARHVHSTLSDEGIDDDDLMGVEGQQQSDDRSRGSIGHPSSAAQSNVDDVDWGFRPFSSAQPHDEQLPETVPIPSQLEDIRTKTIETIEGRNRLDFSETCTTAHRSSPFNMIDALIDPFEFVPRQSQMQHLSASIDGEPADIIGQRPSKASKSARASPRRAPTQRREKPYNTRSGPQVSYADGDSSFDGEDDSDVVSSPDIASRPRAQNANKKTSPKEVKAPGAVKKVSPKRKRLEARVDDESPQATERRKRKQRPKTPLPIDDETQRVPITLPTTPPVTDQRPKRYQKRQSKRPPATKPKARGKNKKPQNAAPAAALVTTSPELGSEQPAQVPSDAHSDNACTALHETAPLDDFDQNEEAQDGISIAESTHSTSMTTPSMQPSPQRISSMQVPLLSRQPQPPPSLPLGFEDVQDSVESVPAARPPFMGDLSALVPRNASRRDEDICHRLQEIHKANKGKDVGSVASVYRKNGTAIVDRLQRRFAKEHHTLLQKVQEDSKAFIKCVSSAKRGLREGARDRQRVLKDLDRNAKKRQQTCSKEVSRIRDIAKRIQN